jgi:hypothetical protein
MTLPSSSNPTPKAVAMVLAVLAVAGCTLNKTELRRDNILARIGGGGQIIEPKRCALQVAVLARPIHDPALDVAVWNAADEQVILPEVRHALEVNGLRAGLIMGSLPAEVESILNAPPPHKVDPSQLFLYDGDNTLVTLSEQTPAVSLLLCRENQAFGKDYQDASGWCRITAKQEGTNGVALRFVPEIHHGPIQHAFSAVPTGGSLAPHQFRLKDGQEEETLRDLAATLTLQPGQVAVLGCRPEKERSLGTFLFTQPEAGSDRLLQKVLLVWASRTTQGLPTLEPIDPPDSDMPQPMTSRQKPDATAIANAGGSKPASPKSDKDKDKDKDKPVPN